MYNAINKIKKPDMWMKTLVLIQNGHNGPVSKIARELDSHYSYIAGVVNSFEELNWAIVKKVGRMKMIHLTEEGRTLAHHLNEVLNILRGI